MAINDPSPSADTPPVASETAGASGGSLRWLIPVLILAGLATWVYLQQDNSDGPQQRLEVSEEDMAGAVEEDDEGFPDVDIPDMSQSLTGLFDKYQTTLSTVKDEASAKAAAPALKGFNETLEAMEPTFQSLPPEKRTSLAEKVAGLLEPLQASIDKVYAIPGVKPILEPILANMQERIAAFLPAAQS